MAFVMSGSRLPPQILNEGREWTAYTPQWSASTTSPSIGNGTIKGRYARLGQTAWLVFSILWGSNTSSGTGTYTLSLPSGWSLADTDMPLGSFMARDNSAAQHTVGLVTADSATTMMLRYHGGNVVTGTAPYTWAQHDWIRGFCLVELA